jgi:hypothetical protein
MDFEYLVKLRVHKDLRKDINPLWIVKEAEPANSETICSMYVLTRIKMTLLRHADNADILRLDVRWMSERQTIRYSSIYLSFEMHMHAF